MISVKGVDFLRDSVHTRAVTLANYIIDTGATVIRCDLVFGISKSTVHKDATDILKYSDLTLYERVQKVLAKNKAERHIRGGIATKNKYLKTQNFKRMRIGIGSNDRIEKKNWVLGRFSKEEAKNLEDPLKLIESVPEDFIKMSFSDFMNKYNKEQ